MSSSIINFQLVTRRQLGKSGSKTSMRKMVTDTGTATEMRFLEIPREVQLSPSLALSRDSVPSSPCDGVLNLRGGAWGRVSAGFAVSPGGASHISFLRTSAGLVSTAPAVAATTALQPSRK